MEVYAIQAGFIVVNFSMLRKLCFEVFDIYKSEDTAINVANIIVNRIMHEYPNAKYHSEVEPEYYFEPFKKYRSIAITIQYDKFNKIEWSMELAKRKLI